MPFSRSLRLRLLTLILVPLMIVAIGTVVWQYRQSAQSATRVFDQQLSIITLAIFRDLLATSGEELTPATRALLEEASGATFFYHVVGPDGSFVTGYSPPPTRPEAVPLSPGELTFFQSTHRGLPVQVVQFVEQAIIDGLSGKVQVSVWQRLDQRQLFANRLSIRGLVIAGVLLFTATIAVFFGVRRGLRPLSSLEDAISRRSSADLAPIRRSVPDEVVHIVRRLNDLFAEVTSAQAEKDRFISNAAHQLRNPIAGIQSLAEVSYDAKSLSEARKRTGELVEASRDLARLAEQMLSYERLRSQKVTLAAHHLDTLLQSIATAQAGQIMRAGIDFSFLPGAGDAMVEADPTMLEQALVNILDNALKHGGDKLTELHLVSLYADDHVTILITNDGLPVPQLTNTQLFERFEQASPATSHGGAGLGLAIVSEICTLHGGVVSVTSDRQGFRIDLPTLPAA